jgi:hypothetical protein
LISARSGATSPAHVARAKNLNIATARCAKDFLAKTGALIFTITQ